MYNVCIMFNHADFIPLSQLNLSNDESLSLFWELRGAFEDAYPNRMTDASDAYVLTVFPLGEGDEIPDDYEVEDWAAGRYREQLNNLCPILIKGSLHNKVV